MSIDLNALATPFPPAAIEWRVGSTTADKKSGIALAYITARDVMERLDSVCGAANWQDRYEFHGSRTVCYLSVRIDSEWVTKADGAGDSDVEAEKGAISDALKRAAVKWGIGRYLYDLESPWVELSPAGRSYKIKDSEKQKLHALLTRNANAIAQSSTNPRETSVEAPLDFYGKPIVSGGHYTAKNRPRGRGPRLSDAGDVNTIMDALKDNVKGKGSADALMAWVKVQWDQIKTLPDKAYDELMDAIDAERDRFAQGEAA